MDKISQVAEADLINWRAIDEMRDDLVRRVHAAGISIKPIHALTGVGRATIYPHTGSTPGQSAYGKRAVGAKTNEPPRVIETSRSRCGSVTTRSSSPVNVSAVIPGEDDPHPRPFAPPARGGCRCIPSAPS